MIPLVGVGAVLLVGLVGSRCGLGREVTIPASVIAGAGALVGLFLVDQRLELLIPTPLYALVSGSAVLVGIV